MSDTSLKDPILQSCEHLFPSFGLECKFMCELPESSLNSADSVNILAGFSKGVQGNISLGLTKEATLAIVSGMMGGMQVSTLDEMGKSALNEFMTMLCGILITKIDVADIVHVSSPTIVMGSNLYLMISRAPSRKLFFKMGDTKFNIAYCLE